MDSCPPPFGTQAPPKRQPRATQKQHAIACTRANSKTHPLEIAYGFLPSPLWHPSTTQEAAKSNTEAACHSLHKGQQQNPSTRNCLWILALPPLAPKHHPRGSQELPRAPRGHPRATKRTPRASKSTQGAPKGHQEAAKFCTWHPLVGS